MNIAKSMSLIHDELEEFRHRSGKSHTFRVRVWRGQVRRTVVLVTQTLENEETFMLSAKVANWVVEGILRHSGPDIMYFESSMVKGQPPEVQSLSEVIFGYFGKIACRSRLIDPTSYPCPWSRLEELLGHELKD